MKEQFAASAARKQPRREKSPSELGEEVLALMLNKDAKERAAVTPAPPKIKAAEEAPKTAQYGGFTQEAAGNAKAAQYGGDFTEKTAAGNRKTAPYGGAGAGRTAAQYTLPAASESSASHALTAAGLDDNAIRGAQWNNVFPSAMQNINQRIQKTNEITAPIRATPEWQALAASQDLAAAGLDASAQQGLAYGDGLFQLDQRANSIRATPEWQALAASQDLAAAGLDASAQQGLAYGDGLFQLDQRANSIRATPEWQALAASQDLAAAGLDASAQQGFGIGFDKGQPFATPLVEWTSQLVEDTHLAPGTSAREFFGDKFKSGLGIGSENAWNGLIDLGEGAARNDLMLQDFDMQQFPFLNDRYREYIDLNRMRAQQVRDGLPDAAEGLRSHKAAEYAKQIDELYDAGGLYRFWGDIVSSIGETVPAILTNILTDGSGKMAYLYTSAVGKASAEARAGGADEDTTLLYGMVSGGVKMAAKQLGGIVESGMGTLDKWLMGMVESKVGRAALKQLYKMLGKSTVNLISKVAGTYLARMWNDDERGFRQTMGETLPDAFYEGLIGTLIDSIRSVLDSIDEKETQMP